MICTCWSWPIHSSSKRMQMGVRGTQSNKVFYCAVLHSTAIIDISAVNHLFWGSNGKAFIFLPALKARYCYCIHFSILSLDLSNLATRWLPILTDSPPDTALPLWWPTNESTLFSQILRKSADWRIFFHSR